MEPVYKNTQPGYVFIVVLSICFLFLIPSITESLLSQLLLVVYVFVGFIFSGLTTEVYKDRVVASFRGGIIKRTVFFEDVNSVKAVKNQKIFGWGIRYLGNGWMYNVSGFDAVELALANGRRFRIGTNKPEELEDAIWKYLPNLG